MKYTYKPQGVCATEIIIEVEEDIIRNIEVINSCDGNSKGIASLIKGMKIEDVIKKLKGIKCKRKNTSCPDQIAIALEKIKEEKNEHYLEKL